MKQLIEDYKRKLSEVVEDLKNNPALQYTEWYQRRLVKQSCYRTIISDLESLSPSTGVVSEEEIKGLKIDLIDKVTVMLSNDNFQFSYTVADAVVRDEHKGKYRYFGGLQSNYDSESKEHEQLRSVLSIIAESLLAAYKAASTPVLPSVESCMERAHQLDISINRNEFSFYDEQLQQLISFIQTGK